MLALMLTTSSPHSLGVLLRASASFQTHCASFWKLLLVVLLTKLPIYSLFDAYNS